MVLQNELSIDRLKKMRQDIAEDKDFNPNCTLLIDVRLTKFHISIKEVRTFGKWFRQNSKLKPSNKKVFLTTNPDQVVKSFVFGAISYISSFKIFSTTEACLKFLELDISNNDLVNVEINKLII